MVTEILNRNLAGFYAWLRRFSRRLLLHERADHTLEATALANEVFAKLCAWDGTLAGEDQDQQGQSLRFLAASVARQVLVDHARRRLRLKRGADFTRVSLHSVELGQRRPEEEILELETALREFELLYPEEARLVHLRFFGGATMLEAASLLGWSDRTAARRWAFAKAWLRDAMASDVPEPAAVSARFPASASVSPPPAVDASPARQPDRWACRDPDESVNESPGGES